jgi:uncharacterized coiled-coil DUF342 family protein
MTVEEEVVHLRKEHQELREALKQVQELLRVALARIEELEKQKNAAASLCQSGCAQSRSA